MQSLPNQRLFRSFSANDWNQTEINPPSLSFVFISLILSTFSSNAENLRKIESFDTKNQSLESFRTSWSNGLQILFPIILDCLNFFNSIR